MDDSRVGASGAQALALLLLLRGAALASLGRLAAAALVAAAVWARVAPLIAMARFPDLRPGGTAAFHRRHWRGLARELRPTALLVFFLLALLLLQPPLLGWASWPSGTPAWPGPLGLMPAAAGLVPALAVPLWLGRRLGGHSGDSYGACVEWTETLALLLAAALSLALCLALAPSLGPGAAG
jgi:adenosylcobinamide-GDP ribazoletransferase